MAQAVSDFIEIVGDAQITIGDGLPLWEKKFSTLGRTQTLSALLIFNIKGLTYATSDVDVKINNKSVGTIRRYGGLSDADRDETAKYWYTQMIALNGMDLIDGVNEIQIMAVNYPGANNADLYDDFSLKNVVCFFHRVV